MGTEQAKTAPQALKLLFNSCCSAHLCLLTSRFFSAIDSLHKILGINIFQHICYENLTFIFLTLSKHYESVTWKILSWNDIRFVCSNHLS